MLKRVAIFASGNGSNFEALYQAQVNKEIDISIELVVTNNKDAYVIKRAQEYNVEVYIVDYKKDSESEIEANIIKQLKEKEVTLVLLAGYLKKIGPLLINHCPIINIHPSYLPKYKGLNAIERAFMNGDEYIGVSVHYIDEQLDNGPIIMQEGIRVNNNSLEKTIEEVHKLEHHLYVASLQKVLEEI